MPIAAAMRSLASTLVLGAVLALTSACGGGGDGDGSRPAPAPQENPQFRAIAGISMGAFGAANLGTKYADVFGAIGALGGPVDMKQLLHDSMTGNLEVRPQAFLPRMPGDDFTFDHLPPYPDRGMRLSLSKDLFLAFGNPFLHHPDPAKQYLASDSEAARLRIDDRFGTFTLPGDPRGFQDGGDTNRDGVRQVGEAPATFVDVLLAARGSLASIDGGRAGAVVGDRELIDLDGDGIYDVGDGLVVNFSEPFTDGDQDGVFEPELGDTYQDVGLDGVAGTRDQGEGNGVFDYDPDRQNWIDEDPLTRLASRSAADIERQRIYLDVGTGDEFGFAQHYANLVATLESKGLPVAIHDGFSANCARVPDPTDAFTLYRYEGGHTGIPDADSIVDDLNSGDLCSEVPIWQRLITLLGWLNQSFPDGNYGLGRVGPRIDLGDFDFDIGKLDLRGDLITSDIPSPALAVSPDGPIPTQQVLLYRPPKFSNTSGTFPIVYFLGGYGQSPGDFRRVRDLMDLLIAADEVQNLFIAFLPGAGGVRGSFYVNHRVPESQVPDAQEPTSGRYEDSIFQDLIPVIENDLADGRIRRPGD